MPQSLPSPLRLALESLPEGAKEPIVSTVFAFPKLIEALGFSSEEAIPAYNTGTVITDFALRKNLSNSDVFLQTKTNPFLLIELKGRHINLKEGSAGYLATVKQLKTQLLDERAKSCQWGLITNGTHIQLFRKHGKVIFPATTNIFLTSENVDKVVKEIKGKIDNTQKALTVSIYNNKGGVGKTTTTMNLAGTLALLGKKVLVIDFDWNQRDLSTNLGIDSTKGLTTDILFPKESNLSLAKTKCVFEMPRSSRKVSFDAIPAHQSLSNFSETELIQKTDRKTLYEKLLAEKILYDYILIDTPPNWRYLTQLVMFATDVIMVPTRHNDIRSLHNIAEVIKKFIPEVRAVKNDGTPEVLPIFFNGQTPNDSRTQATQAAIYKIINDCRVNDKVDLLPYFYPKYTEANKDLSVHHLPNSAYISSYSFKFTPAVLRVYPVFVNYRLLAEEYFLQ